MRIEMVSKSVCRRAVAATALLLLSAVYAQARVETYSGACNEPWKGNTWLVIVTYDDNGHIAHMCGTNCVGLFWEDRCLFGIVAGNPDLNGDVGTIWSDGSWVRLSIADNGLPTRAWGLGRDGLYWMTEAIMLN